MEPTRTDVWNSVGGLPPVTGEHRTATTDLLARARQSTTRAKWYAASAVAAIGGAALTVVVHRATGAYYPFISGFAMLFVISAGFGPTLVAALGSLVLANLIPPVGGMLTHEPLALIRLGANAILLVVASVLAGMLRRSRLATLEREARLERSAASVREVLEGSTDAIILTDDQLRITYVNKSAADMFGYASADVLGRSVTSIVTPESLNRAPLQIEALRSGQSVHSERTAFRADGGVIDVDISARFLSGGRLLASVRDSSSRKREAERQRTERDLLNGILATSVAGVAVVDTAGAIIFANRRAESLLDLSKDAGDSPAYRRPAWRQVALDDGPWPPAEEPFRRVMATGEPVFDVRFAIVWPDGRRRAISVNGAPLRNATGQLQAVVFAVNDITEALAADQALRERERQLETITSAMPGIVYQYVMEGDGRDRFEYVSAYSARLVGLTPEEMREDGSRAWAMVHPEDIRAMQLSVLESFRTMSPWEHEFRTRDLSHPGSWRWLSGRGIPQAGPTPGSVLWNGIFINITDRKALEADLLQAQKIESVGRLAGGIAHDFNNLLTVILGQAELLALDLPADSPHLEGVTQIRVAAESGSSLTRQLLGFARRQLVAPQVVDLNALARRVPALMGRLLGEDVSLELVLAEDPPHVRVDPAQFDQVLMNLVVNARDAMPVGGRVELRTRRIEADDPARAEFAQIKSGALAELAVTDTGTGMSADVRDRAFEPFFTTKGLGKGTGLGLATSFGLVTQAGGTLVIDSRLGEGTTIRVVLPVTDDAPTLRPTPTETTRHAGDETLLVVDDDAAVRGVTAAALRRHGYRVIEADSGATAIGHSRAERGRIHLLVTDVVMPQMTGPQLVEHLKRERPDMRVLYVSGYAEGAVHEHGVLNAGLELLQKPYDIGVLAQRVRALLET
jgi:two-component system, cell cycle sensor histidine kinase and response regulator CckA